MLGNDRGVIALSIKDDDYLKFLPIPCVVVVELSQAPVDDPQKR